MGEERRVQTLSCGDRKKKEKMDKSRMEDRERKKILKGMAVDLKLLAKISIDIDVFVKLFEK